MNSPGWHFDNSYSQLPLLFFIKQKPTKVSGPKLVLFNKDLAVSLGLDADALSKESESMTFAGNKIPEGADPIAQAYAGHQFGHFNKLGDGRAILLGEHLTPEGRRFDIQLKGSGVTPYSRNGDGRAALGPMLREYIISEAMHVHGIPTTRSLAVATTGEPVYRDRALPGAILTRVASSHIRVGTFQYASALDDKEIIQSLADYTIHRHFPELENAENKYLSLLKCVIGLQAELVAKWMQVGFIHGVMNTDNMAICGETIDYGPCAFMDSYDPETVFSSIDTRGRYAYGNQPQIAQWNLARFAETLLPLLHHDLKESIQMAENAILTFPDLYQEAWLSGMREKLGLFNEKPDDLELVNALLSCMKKYKLDYTNTFRELASDINQPLLDEADFISWHSDWLKRLQSQDQTLDQAIQLMLMTNPAVIPRNHLVEEALTASENGEMKIVEKLLAVLSDPFTDKPIDISFRTPPLPSITPYKTFCGT
jgi:uncharacterized protein YdiU (UPF0061 family)